jgi:hypothetical protein
MVCTQRRRQVYSDGGALTKTGGPRKVDDLFFSHRPFFAKWGPVLSQGACPMAPLLALALYAPSEFVLYTVHNILYKTQHN